MKSTRLLLFAVILSCGSLLQAGAQSPSLTKAKITYDNSLQKITASRQDLHNKAIAQYQEKLGQAFESYRKAGELEPMLAIKKEQAALAKADAYSAASEPGLPDAVAKIHQQILAGLGKREATVDGQLARLQGQYLNHLQKLKQEFTKKEKLEEALAVRDEMDRIKTGAVKLAEPALQPPPSRLQPPVASPLAPAPVLSGKLPKALKNELVLHFPFDKKSKMHEDDSGERHHGDARGLTWVKEGKVKGCANFQGSSMIVVPHHDDLAFKDQFTFSVWCRLKHDLSKYYRSLEFVSKTSTEGVDGYWCAFDGPKDGFRFRLFQPDGAASVSWPEAIEIKAATWHHFAVTCANEQLTLYVDGRKVGDKALNQSPIPNARDLIIGYHLAGDLDELMFFKRGLSEAEIQTLYGSQDQ